MSQQINLFNPAYRKSRTPISLALIATYLAATLAAALLFYGYTLYRVADAEKRLERNAARLKAGQAELAGFSPGQAKEALRVELLQLEKKAADANRLADGLRRAGADNNDGYSDALRALTRQLMPGLSLTGYTLNGETISMEGEAASPDLLPKYIGKLGGERALQDKNLSSLQVLPRKGDAHVEFTLSLTRNAGGGR